MTSEEMLYEFELSADKVSGSNEMNLSLPAKVAYLNRGQRSLILSRYDGAQGFEEKRRRTDELQTLVMPLEDLTVTAETSTLYSAKLSGTSKPYLILLRHVVYGSKDKCKSVIIDAKETQTDDLNEALRDPFRRPDFQWREALLSTADGRLFVHTDGFKVEKVQIQYLREPRKIDVAGYIDFSNAPSENVDCELPVLLHDSVILEAVANLKADLGDPAYQSALYKKQEQEG